MRILRLSRPLPIIALIALAAILAAPPFRARESSAQPATDPDPLRELAERLLTPSFGPAPVESADARLLLGALPPDLPLERPLPPGSRLLGSVVRPSRTFDGPPGPGVPAATGLSVEVVADAPGEAAEIIAFYRSVLTEQGWSTPPLPGPGPGGFLPSNAPTGSAVFCRGAGAPYLTVSVRARPDRPNDLRIFLDTVNPGPCRVPGPPGGPSFTPPGFDRLPSLSPPQGVEVFPRGSGGGDGYWSSRAVVQTERALTELEAHYARQLDAAGWQRLDGGAGARLIWSLWRIPGEGEWDGLLTLRDGPGEGIRTLQVEVASPTRGGWGGGIIVGPR